MNGYICTKALTLSGFSYQPGEHIPAEAVLPSRVRALTNQGYIAAQAEQAQEPTETPQEEPGEPAPIVIPLTRDGGVFEVVATPESIITAACNLQLTAEAGIEAIKTMTDETALILIHALDSRKTVKAAAQDRAEELGGEVPEDMPEGYEEAEAEGQGDS